MRKIIKSNQKATQYIVIFATALYKTIRIQLGSKGVCIYEETCSLYAKRKIKTCPIYKALPLILMRVLSCNPITAIALKIIHRIRRY